MFSWACLRASNTCSDETRQPSANAPRKAMDIDGHPTIEMTMNVNGHVSLDEKREALDKLGTLFEED